jgi:DNA polymerase II large subunit
MTKKTNAVMEKYFKDIDDALEISYSIAQKAREKGFDPQPFVEMPLARDISERVEGLIAVAAPQIVGKGMVERIKELENKYSKLDWRVCLEIAYEVAREDFCTFKDKAEAMSIGAKAGLTYLTLGIVSAPLEGFIGFEIKKRRDGDEYLAMSFAGPIRAAGGTAGAVAVIIGDYVRKKMGYKEYDPDEKEIKRFHTELMDYNDRCVRLQYIPSEEETRFLLEHMPIEITGNASESIEVSNYKDLPRIPTNVIRGGMCLVVGECLIQKAPKLNKRIEDWGHDMDMDQWLFLADFLKLQKKIKAKSSGGEEKKETEEEKKNKPKILPNYKFVQDLVAGRPVFTFPMRKGGFRLRYGRNRTSGFASNSVSSQTMEILDDFIGVGTQLKIERPGKATVITACDTLEPPIVKLKTGEVKVLYSREEAKGISSQIEEILHLGDLLIGYGEFSENNHPLVPNGYCEEEWALELVEKINQK